MHEGIEVILRGGQFKRLIELTIHEIRKRTGLKRVEVEILYFLHNSNEKNTMKDICHYMQMNKGHISIALDGLCKKGYITQNQDAEDRRYIHYHLTDSSNEIVEQIDIEWNKMMVQLAKGISEEELEQFKLIARKIGNNIEEILKE